jgi:CheY-like chemotaxis protein/HPt (histidine-containing phosphotransfer) domain-containing protein
MPLRILLAEDNHVNQRVATRLLTKLGHDVQLAENGQLALDALERSEFDVVLMDVQMPVLDGLEAVAAIRRRETSTGLHQVIIAMTAHTMSGDRERCLDAGMDHYISKPIDAAAVCEALKRVTDQFRLPRAASTPEATETPSASTQPSAFDMDVALAKFDGERDFMMEIAGIFLGGLSDQMTSLKVTLEQGDVSAAARVAHTIKGSVGNFAAERAYAAALQLEKDCRAGNTESLSESHQYFVKEIDRLAEDLRREDAVSV